jgi:hypothetical protein
LISIVFAGRHWTAGLGALIRRREDPLAGADLDFETSVFEEHPGGRIGITPTAYQREILRRIKEIPP